MSLARPSLLSAGAALALAVAVAVPGTAAADPGPGKADANKGKAGQQASEDRPSGRGGERPSGDEDAGQDRRKETTPRSSAARPEQRPSAASPKADPRGNNGTIKIDTVPADEARANRPHPGCTFALTFFGFDADQHADIVFTGQAPTASGTLLSLSDRLISTTPADGSMETGHTLTLTAADLGLVGTPQAAKGWHVKVTVDAVEAPGGAKQKVFWLDCPQADAPAPQTQPTAVDDDATVVPNGLPAAAPAPTVGVLGAATERARLLDQVGPLATRDRTSVATAAAQSPAETVAARTSTPGTSTRGSVLPFGPDTLPFTGPAALAALLAGGLSAVGAGALAVRAGRRRAG